MISSDNDGKAAITQKYLGLDSLSDGVNPLVYATPQTVNALPFLAYQKVYFDFYSNSQWEKHLAYAYNVDYWTGNSSISLATDMLKLRYADYPKDYFTGILPASQYGSVAVMPQLHSHKASTAIFTASTPNFGDGFGDCNHLQVTADSFYVTPTQKSAVNRDIYLNSDLSALSIRATEYLQRWKEVVQFSSKDYSDQMAARFGIKAPVS